MKSSRKLLFGKSLLIAFSSTIAITVLLVYFTGLTSHRSILDNTIISLTILSIFFFFFIAIGLYKGLNVFDNYSHKLELRWKNTNKNSLDRWSGLDIPMELPDSGEGLGGIILGILLWIILTIVFIVLLFILSTVIWATLILVALAIYWTLIRALKLVFSKSSECEGDLPKCATYALGYTFLYVGWIFGVIYLSTLI